MMKAVLKTLAISFGGGLALGAGIRLTQGGAKSRREPGIDLHPLLSRLKDVESRIVELESGARVESPATAEPSPSEVIGKTLVAFEARLAAQLNEVEQMRGDIRRVDQCLADLDSQLPVLVQSTVNVRFQEAERKLQHDFEEAQSRSMAAFVDTLQSKVVERINTLEANLAEQSQVIGKLRDASVRSDENLQKMLAGIERLVDQSRAPAPATAVSSGPPAPAPVPPESPADVYQAASAIVRKDLGGPSESARSKVTEVVHEPAPRRNTPLVSTSPELSVPPSLELPKDTPVLEWAPKISPTETPKTAVPETPILASVAAASAELPQIAAAAVVTEPPPAEPLKLEESYEWVNKIGLELLAPRPKPRLGWRIPLVIGLAAGLILIVGLLYSGMLRYFFEFGATQQTSTLASASPAAPEPPAPLHTAKPDGGFVELDVAREYQRRKDWTKAESAYRTALESNPNNRDAAIGLSDVLYQEQKYEESAAVLNKLRSARFQ
jgi:uncharacterized coiled-coil protein SlyX